MADVSMIIDRHPSFVIEPVGLHVDVREVDVQLVHQALQLGSVMFLADALDSFDGGALDGLSLAFPVSAISSRTACSAFGFFTCQAMTEGWPSRGDMCIPATRQVLQTDGPVFAGGDATSVAAALGLTQPRRQGASLGVTR